MLHHHRSAVWAGLFAGVSWGLFWIPLRLVESFGLSAPWAMAVFTFIPIVLCLPVAWVFRRDYVTGGRGLMGGILGGVAFALYAASLLYTDVVRAVLLFYLMPIWGFLLGWVILGDRITWLRWLSIALGVVGLAVIFADDTGLPLPRNIGDWCGLISGMFWAVGCLLILVDERVDPRIHAVNFFAVGALISVAAAFLANANGLSAAPDWEPLRKALLWMIPISLVLVLPAGFATIYAPTKLNPGVVGLLFMLEIVVATITAAIWAGEPIGPREYIGLALVLLAGVSEPFGALLRPNAGEAPGQARGG